MILLFFALPLFSCAHHSDFQKPSKKVQPNRYNVGILIMDGVYNTEFTAPYDIFQHTKFRKGIKAMNVFSLAKTLDPIRTFEGVYVYPDFNYLEGDYPPIDILVIPSAEHHLDSDLNDEKMISFVQTVANSALFVTSHCDGAFVLAKAGLLENKLATTFPADHGKMREMFPNVDVRDSVMFVHDGRFITSVGGAKSFEAALYLCQVLYGKKVADRLAEGLVITWDLNKTPHLIVDP